MYSSVSGSNKKQTIFQNQLYLPEDLLAKHKVNTTELMNSTKISSETCEALMAVTYEVASQAHGHLERVR